MAQCLYTALRHQSVVGTERVSRACHAAFSMVNPRL